MLILIYKKESEKKSIRFLTIAIDFSALILYRFFLIILRPFLLKLLQLAYILFYTRLQIPINVEPQLGLFDSSVHSVTWTDRQLDLFTYENVVRRGIIRPGDEHCGYIYTV